MNTLKDRIQGRLEALKASPADLARACQVSQASVTQWLDGSTKKLQAISLYRAAAFLQCSSAWLAWGEGPMETSVTNENSMVLTQEEQELVKNFRRLTNNAKRTLLGIVSGMLLSN